MLSLAKSERCNPSLSQARAQNTAQNGAAQSAQNTPAPSAQDAVAQSAHDASQEPAQTTSSTLISIVSVILLGKSGSGTGAPTSQGVATAPVSEPSSITAPTFAQIQ